MLCAQITRDRHDTSKPQPRKLIIPAHLDFGVRGGWRYDGARHAQQHGENESGKT